jgi:hypothetical protein
MNAQQLRSKAISEKACAYAENTWVAETRSGVIIICHAGQDTSILQDHERLRNELGVVDPSVICRLSESSEAPIPWSMEREIAAREAALERLHAEQAQRGYIDQQVLAAAEGELLEARGAAAE